MSFDGIFTHTMVDELKELLAMDVFQKFINPTKAKLS